VLNRGVYGVPFPDLIHLTGNSSRRYAGGKPGNNLFRGLQYRGPEILPVRCDYFTGIEYPLATVETIQRRSGTFCTGHAVTKVAAELRKMLLTLLSEFRIHVRRWFGGIVIVVTRCDERCPGDDDN
jgi:hypothetical protein